MAIPLHLVYMSGQAFVASVETDEIEGVAVCVYSAAKTVVDCFKFRNRRHRHGLDDLWHYAKIDRVDRVMRPYLDMLS